MYADISSPFGIFSMHSEFLKVVNHSTKNIYLDIISRYLDIIKPLIVNNVL